MEETTYSRNLVMTKRPLNSEALINACFQKTKNDILLLISDILLQTKYRPPNAYCRKSFQKRQLFLLYYHKLAINLTFILLNLSTFCKVLKIMDIYETSFCSAK